MISTYNTGIIPNGLRRRYPLWIYTTTTTIILLMFRRKVEATTYDRDEFSRRPTRAANSNDTVEAVMHAPLNPAA